mgnify:CR=1 FL=1
MEMLQKICFVLLLTTLSSVYAGNCFEGKDIEDCRVKAEQGDSSAQYNLALMYSNGKGVPQDSKEAAKWYRKSAKQGDQHAQNKLGTMYRYGWGVSRDYQEAVKWYRLAAEQGLAKAQYNLGVMYAKGQGVLKDSVMAHMYWNMAAVSEHEDAIKGRGIVEKKK